ncbi:MAG: hypothetical protein CMP91_06795 [Gammaproteobacteria bacterium]|nr:hypothetical protein [Gammaproteobacteria bacterium]|tara:strand:- start:26464 stop:28608 length:2145 start_codon:yes stop_codon:yes gene_type:complete
MRRITATGLALSFAALVLPVQSGLAQPSLPENPVHFTQEQAERGRQAYMQGCVVCHGDRLDNGEFGFPLIGSAFENRWAGVSAATFSNMLRETMPPGGAGTLSNQTYTDLMAFIFQQNEVPAGNEELPANPEQLASLYVTAGGVNSQQAALRVGGPGGGFASDVNLPPWPEPRNPLNSIENITQDILNNPPDGSWLTWRRDYEALAYSPLDEINRRNVDELKLAWSLTLPAGPNESTPLVHDGVMFVQSFNDNIMALNALTGDELWHYRRNLPEGVNGRVQRNIAVYEDKIYASTSDGHVIALDMRTGRLVWEADLGSDTSGGPLVAQGVVMQGTMRSGGGPDATFIQGLDAETGEQMWRFYVIPQPGEPGSNTWNNVPYEELNGGSVWTAGSYDPVNNLALFGTAQTYDTGPLMNAVDIPGVNNDALYTNTTLAFDPQSGELVWYFQHFNNDQHDFDWAFERMVTEIEIGGEQRRVVITGGKLGYYDILDAATGEYLSSYDMGLQNLILGVDPETDRKIVDYALYPDGLEDKQVCPHAGGGRSWIPGAYNPETGRMFAPAVETCMTMILVGEGERGSLSSGYRWTIRPRENSDGRYGHIQAFNVGDNMTEHWTARQRPPQSSGVLATAGGIVFAGALDRSFSAYDDRTGERLWNTRLNDVPNSGPISFSIEGKQYIGVVVGYGGAQSVSFPRLVPEITLPAVPSSTVWVFELP